MTRDKARSLDKGVQTYGRSRAPADSSSHGQAQCTASLRDSQRPNTRLRHSRLQRSDGSLTMPL